jgi:LacI family transcriptional regulator
MPKIALAMELDWVVSHHYDIIHGVQSYAADAGDWELAIGRFPEIRLDHGVKFDGIVGRITPSILERAQALGIPVVNVWQNSPVAPHVPCVFSDAEEAGRTAAQHLYARGLRQFAHVGARGWKDTTKNFGGASAFAKEVNCPIRKVLLSPNFEESLEKSRRAVATLARVQEDWPHPIGVIVAGPDVFTRMLVIELTALGWSVPHDAAVVATFSEELACTTMAPTVTSLDANRNRVGYQAAELLAGLIGGAEAPTLPILVPPKALTVRQSSDVFAVDEPRVAAALRFMADHSDMSVSIDDVAKHAGLSSQSLNALFNEHLGHSMLKELMRLRVEHLKRMLLETEDPLDVICERSGFGTRATMHRNFKRLTGETPAEFRERMRER